MIILFKCGRLNEKKDWRKWIAIDKVVDIILIHISTACCRTLWNHKLIWFIILKGTFKLFDSFNSLLTESNMKFSGEVFDCFHSHCRLECCDVLQSVFWYCESLPGSPLHINTKIIFSHSFPCRKGRGNSPKFLAWKYLNYLNIDTVRSVIFIPW